MVTRMSESLKECPHCAELVLSDAIICRFCDRGICRERFKNCPHCAEMIWTNATYCRYCKSSLRHQVEWGSPDRKTIFEQIKANTGIHLDDDAIDKIFKRMSRKAE